MSVTSVGFNPISPLPFAADIRVQPAKHNESVNASVSSPKQEAKEKPHVVHSTAADLERMGLAFNRRLQFVMDQNSSQVIVKVIDKETDKVIKELPPEELQRLHRNLKEAIGLLFDEMV